MGGWATLGDNKMEKRKPNGSPKSISLYIKELSANRGKSIEFLYRAGICTKKGNLKKIYRPENTTQAEI